MSHFTTIKTQIRDIEALRQAVSELGYQLIPNAEARGFVNDTIKGDYVIPLKGPHDIALNRQADGTYLIVSDLWGGYVEEEVGNQYGKMLQLYGVHKAMREARRKGHTVQRQSQHDGSIKLTISTL